MLKNNFFNFFIFFLFISCQPIEKINEIVFDYTQFTKISLSANLKEVNNFYKPKYSDNYIDYMLDQSPISRLEQWLDKNIAISGNENLLEINIINASLKKSEIINNEIKKYKEPKLFLFEISYFVEFILYNDTNSILASTIVEVNRTKSTGKYISIQEKENIIDYLIFQCLKDFSTKSEEFLKIHLKNYII